MAWPLSWLRPGHRRGYLGPASTKAYGFDWCCNKDLNSRAKRVYRVSEGLGQGEPLDSVDWSDLLPHQKRELQLDPRFGRLQSLRSLSNNVDGGPCYMGQVGMPSSKKADETCSADCLTSECLELCWSAMSKLGMSPYEVKEEAGLWSLFANWLSKFEVVVLDGNKSVLRITKPGEQLIKSLVSKHPVVTSLRCTHLDWDEAYLDNDADVHLQYWSNFDLGAIHHSALVIGFSPKRWILFHPRRGVFTVVNRSDIDTGVGDYILVPLSF